MFDSRHINWRDTCIAPHRRLQMARSVPAAVYDHLVAEVERHPVGVGIEDLASAFPVLPRRTLQRHLARLAANGRIRAEGQAAARRYLLAVAPAVEAPVVEPSVDAAAWMSDAGWEVQRLVRRPLMQRKPVGYRRSLLDAYRPNVDAYLPPAVRSRLLELGRPPEGDRPAGTYARQILDRLLIDLSWASSRLEGNTYSRLDTQNLIAFGQVAAGKDQREAQMILNHKGAIEMLVEDAETIGFNRYTLQNLHALLADDLLPDPDAAGRLRSILVSISGTTYQPTGIPQVIDEAFDALLGKADTIEDPFEQAFFVMVHIPYLQPFEDVNKRVSRLAANIPLIKRNLAPLSFVDVPERDYADGILGVYELNRVDLLRDLFAWAYERSCQRYTQLREALPAPDPLRLRYRNELGEIVRETVRGGDAIDIDAVRSRSEELVPSADLDAAVAMAVNELHRLHEGNIARFGLRLSEYRAWKK
jgi:fido (protein-threonine AMPylation protein)